MVSSLGPIAESVFALDLFGRNGAGIFHGWRRQVRDRLGRGVDRVDRLIHDLRPLPNLLWLLGPQGEPPDDHRREHVSSVVFEFCQVAVVPYWGRARTHLEAERDVRGRIMITNGVECLLSTLHPRLRWNFPILEIADEPERDVYLDGRGLLLSPSLFLFGKPGVIVEPENRAEPPSLAFSVPANSAVVSGMLWDTAGSNEQALAALVGHTRAAALQALTESCTTGELSQRLGISLAGASKHATVLRKAGLIATARNRNTALHTLTPLGVALLQS